jgi:hypothetical protein
VEILEIMEEKAIDILVKAITDLSLEHHQRRVFKGGMPYFSCPNCNLLYF